MKTSDRLKGQVGIVIGATSGVGEFTAKQLAAHGCRVILVGRSLERGQEVLRQCQELSPCRHEFYSLDFSKIKNVEFFSRLIHSQLQLLNYLVITAGALSKGERVESEEGLEKFLAISYYSRFATVNFMVDLLQNAARLSQPARVLTCLNPGKGKMPPNQDYELREHFSFLNYLNTSSIYNDLSFDMFSMQYPELSFIHISPGLLNTRNKEGAPVVMRLMMSLIYPFMPTADAFSEYTLKALTEDRFASGLHLLSSKLVSMPKAKDHTDDNRQRIWEHSHGVIKRILD